MDKKRSYIINMVQIALMAALMCIASPNTIPIGPIPLSLATLAIYFIVYIIGWKKGSLSVLIYMLIGMIGLPVFSQYKSGIGVLIGPTGGYLVGYLLLAVVAGLIIELSDNILVSIAGYIAGTFILYLFGTIWYCIYASVDFISALTVCVLPFLLGDAIKIAIAIAIGYPVKKALIKAKILQQKKEA